MAYKNITLVAFIVTCLAQLFIPAKMIFDQEDVLKTGVEYKFRTRPVDPTDPMRGKYITLDFRDNKFRLEKTDPSVSFQPEERVFIEFNTDQEGFAQIAAVLKSKPAHLNYLETTIDYLQPEDQGTTEAFIHFPFDRFYMEEFKAKPAEEAYQQANLDTTVVTYALVHIKGGKAVLKDVIIGGDSIRTVTGENNTEKK